MGSERGMKALGAILVAVVGTLVGGCAKPDWIERTLVTADVTGTWFGISELGGGTGRISLWLDLKQEGPKVTGSARIEGGTSRVIEGTVAGDGFSFHQIQGPPIKGEVTVSGDQMTGDVSITGSYPYRVLQLRRVEPRSRK